MAALQRRTRLRFIPQNAGIVGLGTDLGQLTRNNVREVDRDLVDPSYCKTNCCAWNKTKNKCMAMSDHCPNPARKLKDEEAKIPNRN